MKNDEPQGERQLEASRRYRGRSERFINSTKVDEAAQTAVPTSDQDAAEFDPAEDAGRARAAEEDRLLRDEDEAKSELPR